MAEKYRAEIIHSDFKRMIRELNEVEKDLAKEMRKKFKEVVEPARKGISDQLKGGAPLSGMVKKLSPVGLTWNNRRQSSRVTTDVKSGSKVIGEMRNQTIIRMVVRSPAAIIADMAGSSGDFAYTGKTDWYVYPKSKTYSENYKPGYRRHTVTTQGKWLIRGLDSRWGATGRSRKVYPEAEKRLPKVRDNLIDVLNDPITEINRELE